eukprot:1119323-Rhodomonas_salina.1
MCSALLALSCGRCNARSSHPTRRSSPLSCLRAADQWSASRDKGRRAEGGERREEGGGGRREERREGEVWLGRRGKGEVWRGRDRALVRCSVTEREGARGKGE